MNSLRIWFWDLRCLIIRINGIPRCLGSSRKMPVNKNWMNYLNRSWMSLILPQSTSIHCNPHHQTSQLIPSKSSIKRPSQLSIPSCVTSRSTARCQVSEFCKVRLLHYCGLLLLQHFHGLEGQFLHLNRLHPTTEVEKIRSLFIDFLASNMYL